jgi:hypothetical protein
MLVTLDNSSVLTSAQSASVKLYNSTGLIK